MKYEIIFLPFWVINCSNIQYNDSDVIIKYSGHSDVERDSIQRQNTDTEIFKQTTEDTVTDNISTDNIVFIPNDKPIFRNEDLMKVDDVINTRRVGDVIRDTGMTEKPNEDVIFINGKNNDRNDEKLTKKTVKNDNVKTDKVKNIVNKRKYKVDCADLDCNNTVQSICGGKKENNQWRFRLFLNYCYFRKVNCGFQYAANRYENVTMDKCDKIGGHYPMVPQNYNPISVHTLKKQESEKRRAFASRRSLTLGTDGRNCDHTCPISCTEDYDPQCAVSSAGQRKVFLNHCKLDENSCIQNIAWYRRPLSECVGGKKADMNQNRGFISWLQRVGVIDRNGRLVA